MEMLPLGIVRTIQNNFLKASFVELRISIYSKKLRMEKENKIYVVLFVINFILETSDILFENQERMVKKYQFHILFLISQSILSS
jgi:hypothetical protein